MPDVYAVETRFIGRDQLTPVYRRMEASAAAFNRTASRGAHDTSAAFRNASKHGYQFGTIVKGILAANIIRGGFGLISQGAQSVVGDFIKLDDTLIGAAARFNDIGVAATDFDARVAALKKGTREAILGTKFTAEQAAEVMNELAKADFSSAAAAGALRAQLQLASSTNTDFAESVNISNRLLGAFGMRSDDAQKQIANHVRLNDMLGVAANIANGDLTTLFETMKTAAPVGGIIGTTPEEMLAMGLAIDKAGIDASMAATSLKRAILNIGSADVQKELAANGIQITDNMGKFRRLSDILGDIGAKTNELGLAQTPELTQLFDRMFGKYGLAGVIGLIKNIDQVKEYEKRLYAAAGANKAMDDQLKKGLGYRLRVLGNTLGEFGFKILDAFEYKGKRGIEALNDVFAKADPKPFIAGIMAVLNVVTTLWKILQPFLPFLPYLIQLFIGWKVVMGAIAVANVITGVMGMTGAFTGLGFALAGASAAALPLLAAMTAIVAIWQAGKSLFTGQDNFISQGAQALGLVPKLETNAQGVVTGGADWNSLGYIKAAQGISTLQFPGLDQFNAPAPNAQEAQARAVSFNGQINIAGAPPGSTVSSHTSGAPNIPMTLLGAH